MEFIWRPEFDHLGRKAEIFTHIIYDFSISPFDLFVNDYPSDEEYDEFINDQEN